MAFNVKYQKAYIIIMRIKINVDILYHFFWNDSLENMSIAFKTVNSSISA